MLDDGIRSFLLQQRLGYVATVSADCIPNLSPKGTIFVWDSEHLVFANIRSPQTLRNIRSNSLVEINSVDPISRRGYRFRGRARVVDDKSLHAEILAFYERLKIQSRIREIVIVKVTHVDKVTSPLYDLGLDEAQIREIWRKRLLS